jgi:hypothetical protein
MAKEKTVKVVVDAYNPNISFESTDYSGRQENRGGLQFTYEFIRDVKTALGWKIVEKKVFRDFVIGLVCQACKMADKGEAYRDFKFYAPKPEAKVVEQVVQNVSTIATGTVQQAPQLASADKAMLDAVKQKIAGKNVTPEVLKAYLAKTQMDASQQERIYKAIVTQEAPQPKPLVETLPDL